MGMKVPRGTLLFVSGQVPLNERGQLVGRGDISAQTVQVFKNLQRVVESAGSSMDDIVKMTAYVTDRSHFPTLREVRREFLRVPYPAATGVVVRGLADENWLVEIDAVAVVPDGLAPRRSEGGVRERSPMPTTRHEFP